MILFLSINKVKSQHEGTGLEDIGEILVCSKNTAVVRKTNLGKYIL